MIERSAVERMADSLFHRGPDDSGIYLDASVGMGFRRLSILDLSEAGHQPMVTADQQYVLVFNGEIFNYVELRAELITLGYEFRSSGDSEVLLAAYREWGRECLAKLNGMWAFVIYDRRRRCLFGSRDRFGVKPLYVSRVDGVVQFASEIKALRASGYLRTGINWKTAAAFLLEGRLDSQAETFYEGIEEIPPGSGFEVGLDGTWQQWLFWSLESLSPTIVENPADTFADLFEDSVRIRMRSDVPVGVCLSGGWIRRPSFALPLVSKVKGARDRVRLSRRSAIWPKSLMNPGILPTRLPRRTRNSDNLRLARQNCGVICRNCSGSRTNRFIR